MNYINTNYNWFSCSSSLHLASLFTVIGNLKKNCAVDVNVKCCKLIHDYI